MEYLDYSLLIGILLGLLFWSLFRFISEWNKGRRKECSDKIDDYGPFLEIPIDQIIMAEEQGKEKDLRSLTRKIHAFKARNWFYRDKHFVLEKDLNDFVDML